MTRWLEETGGTRGPEYDKRFRALAEQGADMHGEADFVTRLLPRGSVLDAGCGIGRVAVELARRGYEVMGVDNDLSMLDVARRHELPWVDADLASLDLGRTFDLVIGAGNVIVYLAPGTEAVVIERLSTHLAPAGLLVNGWRTDRMSRDEYDGLVAAAGLTQVARYASWNDDPWREDADWCVAVDRNPALASEDSSARARGDSDAAGGGG